jgi:H+/gluconate symporter-like permease
MFKQGAITKRLIPATIALGAFTFTMDALPHNGAMITLLAVPGLTHQESYGDIFAITLLKTAAVAVAIGVFDVTGIY